jgi:hypothetical protein
MPPFFQTASAELLELLGKAKCKTPAKKRFIERLCAEFSADYWVSSDNRKIFEKNPLG